MSIIAIIGALAVIAILYWLYRELKLPEPFRIVAIVVIALIAIFLVLSITGAGAALHLR